MTAIGCDESGWRHVLGLGVVGTESCDSWLGFLKKVRSRGVDGVMLVTSDAHGGLRRAISETLQCTAWQRCVVHLIRGCVREARSHQLKRRVARIVSPVFRAKDAEVVRATCHLATEMLEECCPRAAHVLENAEPDALAYLDFPSSHGSGCAPTTSRSARTARQGAGRRWCRCFPRHVRRNGWSAPSCATRTMTGRRRATSPRTRWRSSMTKDCPN